MLVLALDTTTRKGSVAIARDEVALDCHEGDPHVTHGQRLPGDIITLLERNGLGVADIELFAVAAGPGSFTGLRIGIATMQGLALANGRSLVGVSALDALNHAVDTACCAAWMDAQRGEVFAALYNRTNLLDGPMVDKPEAVLGRWTTRGNPGPLTFAGEGALAYADLIQRSAPGAKILTVVPPLAPSIARLALEGARHEAALPDAIHPVYVRRPDAELARDRKVPIS